MTVIRSLLFMDTPPPPHVGNDAAGIGVCPAINRIFEIGMATGPKVIASFDMATGTRLLSRTLADCFAPVSGNSDCLMFQNSRGFIITPDGSALACISYSTSTTTHLRLSKIDPLTLLETAAVPLFSPATQNAYAIQHFKLNGVNYVMTKHSGNKIDIINLDTMTTIYSQAFNQTQIENAYPGKKLNENQQSFYSIRYADFNGGQRLRTFYYDRALNTIVAETGIITWPVTTWDAHWGLNDTLIGFSTVDQADGGIIFMISQNYYYNLPGTISDAYLVKVNVTTGAVMWKIAVPSVYAACGNYAPQNGIVNGRYRYAPSQIHPNGGYTYPWAMISLTQWPLLDINTITGAYTVEYFAEMSHPIPATLDSVRAPCYDTGTDIYLFYNNDYPTPAGNGWFGSFGSLSPEEPPPEPVDPDMIGGTMMVLENGLVRYVPAVEQACQRGLNSEIEVGPVRYAEQKQADETSLVSTLIIGLSQQTNPIVFYEDYMDDIEPDEDWLNMGGVNDIYEDWGFDFGDSDDFTAELMSTDDGINSQPQQPEILEPVEDFGAAKYYAPHGYSAITHRIKLTAKEPGESYALKYIDIAGTLTGRHI